MNEAEKAADKADRKEKKEPFEYVAFFDHQPKPGRKRPDELTGEMIADDLEAVLVCARCGYDAHKAGRLVNRVEKFPKGRKRVCETCGGSLKRPVLDPFFAVRDHLKEKSSSSSSSSPTLQRTSGIESSMVPSASTAPTS